MDEDVTECCEARFWEMVPGSIVGTLLLQVREGVDEQRVLKHVHSIYNDIGVKDLTVEIEIVQ
jgi:zinc transporter 5/7